ncbi:MAG TPA: hypothetical protein VK179_13890 [Bacteroidales bacterium]|nr:hypothetical protein [Bacteroidales bacterium]
MTGWIKLHRKFLDWEWYQDANMVHLFLHLLLEANHETRKWRGITINRGQLISGRHELAESTGISERSVRTCLEKLKSTNEIAIQTTNRYSVITICNYDKYQISETEKDQQTDQQPVQQLTSNRPATDHKQEYKEDKNLRNKEDKKKKERLHFVPPTVDEVILYFLNNNYSEEAARRAFNYYTEGNWHDSKGSPVRNWKQKMQAVWFKPENQFNKKTSMYQLVNSLQA